MLRTLALLLWLAVSADTGPQLLLMRGAFDPKLQPLAMHLGGRVEADARGYRQQWPGVYFEAAFKGDSVTLRFDDTLNSYRAQIDRFKPIDLPPTGDATLTIAGLGAGPHHIRLDRVTESNGIGSFGGFFVAPGNLMRAPPARRRQIEFIGDSAMTGYGAHSPKPECTPEQVRTLTDTPAAFAALTAQRYDADYQVNAIQGRGLIRNFGGAVPDVAMAHIYTRLFPSAMTAYGWKDWNPQIIVIKLQADFVGFKPDARWPDFQALSNEYASSYGRFLAQVHQHAPGAAILLWWFDTSGAPPEQRAALDAAQVQISDAARQVGIANLTFLPFPNLGLQNSACHHHFSLSDHQKVAEWLELQIDAHPEYWRDR